MRTLCLKAVLAAFFLSLSFLPGALACPAEAVQARPLPVITPQALETLIQGLGKPLLVVYWASWCGPCQMYRKETLSIIAERYGDDLAMVGISVDTDSSKADAYVRDNDMPFLPLQASPSLYALRKGSSIPATYLYDKDGNEVKQFTGAVRLKRVDYFVRKALGHLPK